MSKALSKSLQSRTTKPYRLCIRLTEKAYMNLYNLQLKYHELRPNENYTISKVVEDMAIVYPTLVSPKLNDMVVDSKT
jgi:hypothetical protein